MAALKDIRLKDIRESVTDSLRFHRRLAARVTALEAEVQECRQVNLRLAELVDVVGELLLPLSQRDETRVAELLERYHRSVGGPST
jgi:hypothetical protein